MGRSRSRSKSHSKSRSRSRSRGRDRERRRSYSRSQSRSQSPEDGYRVHVGDLGIDCDKKEIERTFEKFGPLFEVWVARSPPCFAFVVYRHKEDAEDACREMNGRIVCGQRVKCSPALPRSRGTGRRRFDNNMRCYQCGMPGHFSRECQRGYTFRRNRFTRRSRSMSRSPPPRGSGYFRPRSRSRSRDRKDRRRTRSRTRSRSPRDVNRRDRSLQPDLPQY